MIQVALQLRSPAAQARLAAGLRRRPELQLVDAEEAPADVLVTDDELAEGEAVILLAEGAALAEWAPPRGQRARLRPDLDAGTLAAAIAAVAAGLTVVEAPDPWPPAPRARAAPAPEALTAREREVLRALAAGDGNKQIAARLGITEHTVKFHVASILGKLGAASRTEAVVAGIRLGLVPV